MLTILLFMLSSIVALLATVSQITHLALESDPHGATRYTIALALQLALFAGAAVVFCAWVDRAYRNLSVIQLTAPKLTPAKAIEGFFIPVVNLFHPLDVMWQLWSGSSHSGRERSPVVMFWWLAFLGSWLVALVGGVLGLMGIWGPVPRAAWSVVSQILWIGSCVFGVIVVRGIDIMQKERVQMVADLQSGPAVPISAQARDPKAAAADR
jgi:Domain of unknown function (DUF4328)